LAVDLDKLPGWAELQAAVDHHPHGPTIMLAATIIALQAHAAATEQMLDRFADMLTAMAARLEELHSRRGYITRDGKVHTVGEVVGGCSCGEHFTSAEQADEHAARCPLEDP
jgi:hypothetical protein